MGRLLCTAALCLICVVGWAQERTRTLPELRKTRNKTIQTHNDTRGELDGLERRLQAETKALDAANARVREAEADGGPFASAEIQRRRRVARTIANRKAALMLTKAQLTPRHEFERVAMIDARSAYASRLMKLAYRLGSQPKSDRRTRQIREHTELALSELSGIAKHRTLGKRGSDLGRPVPPLDAGATLDEMQWRAKAYQRQVRTYEAQLKKLKPREARLATHVEHLNRLRERGYALPELTKTLQRERGELTQVQDLRQAIEKQTKYYRQLAKKLQERIAAVQGSQK
ncbi:MAG: hypothetical protein JKY65_06790 [Planctomycetes bacterium]|nr:hypothetical protein [Planctomycetota bacterium]